MATPLLQTLLYLVGLQAATPPGPADLIVIATLGTPCLPAAYARMRFPSLERWTVADSLGRATVSSVPEGDLEIVITHLGTAALSGTVRIVPGETQIVLADLHSRELRTVSHAKLTWARVTEIRRHNPRTEQKAEPIDQPARVP